MLDLTSALACQNCGRIHEPEFVNEADTQPSLFAFVDPATRGGFVGAKDSFTVAEAANQIIRGEPGWSYALGVGFTVSYAFRSNAPAKMPSDTTGFERFNTQQIIQTELSLLGWSDVANVRFVRVGSGTSGEFAYSDGAAMLFSNYRTGSEGAAAFAYYPGSTSSTSAAGDVWVNISLASNQHPVTGSRGALTLAHEVGHAIGLAHPADYNAGADTNITYSANAIYYEDTRQFTVMSYFGEANSGAAYAGRFAAAPQLDDIAAAQLMYGPNLTVRTGDTVYGFNSNAGRPWYEIASSSGKAVFAVWDAGGVDTLDFSGYVGAQTIDLREGAFSSVGGLVGNVAVAVGAVIENARGGAGADTIQGNATGNALFGGFGDDVLIGAGGSNFLRGEAGNDSIVGAELFDNTHGNEGNDTIKGGFGDDWVIGGKDQDLLFGDQGADIVYGNLGADTCYGGDGADVVRGGQGDDLLYGDSGSDWLSGDRGSDQIWGGAGADTFYSWIEAGIDRIMDFDRSQGDAVQLAIGSRFSVQQVLEDIVISCGPGHQLILVGVQQSSLTGEWLSFI